MPKTNTYGVSFNLIVDDPGLNEPYCIGRVKPDEHLHLVSRVNLIQRLKDAWTLFKANHPDASDDEFLAELADWEILPVTSEIDVVLSIE